MPDPVIIVERVRRPYGEQRETERSNKHYGFEHLNVERTTLAKQTGAYLYLTFGFDS